MHSDPTLAARYAEAHRLVKAAVEASAPLSRAAKKEGGCGGCGRAEGLSNCARCKLRAYCSRECQVKDWPAHKQRQVLASCGARHRRSRAGLPGAPGCPQRGAPPSRPRPRRCKAAAELRAKLGVLADPGADKEARRSVMKRLELDMPSRQLAVELKGASCGAARAWRGAGGDGGRAKQRHGRRCGCGALRAADRAACLLRQA